MSLIFYWPKLCHKGTWERENFSLPISNKFKTLVLPQVSICKCWKFTFSWGTREGKDILFQITTYLWAKKDLNVLEENSFVELTFQMLQ